MKELVEYIAKSIVNEPDAVQVEEETTDEGITLKLQVADMTRAGLLANRVRSRRPCAPCSELKLPKQPPGSD